jgi:DNA polymerase-1
LTGQLLLLDATNLGHRLFHAPSDRPLAERFGFALNRWRRAVEPTLAVAVFDGEGDGWRRELWPGYKAKRIDDPSRRPSAQDWIDIKRECQSARLRVAWLRGVEADDLIASYTTVARVLEIDVSIVSSDKDLLQLVQDQPRVRVLDPGTGNASGPEEVRARFGVGPHELADLLALAGDASDGYPGIAGVGFKTAARLVQEHGDVERIIDRANLLPGKLRDRVLQGAEMARVCKRLATLDIDLRLPVPLAEAGWNRPVARGSLGW